MVIFPRERARHPHYLHFFFSLKPCKILPYNKIDTELSLLKKLQNKIQIKIKMNENARTIFDSIE